MGQPPRFTAGDTAAQRVEVNLSPFSCHMAGEVRLRGWKPGCWSFFLVLSLPWGEARVTALRRAFSLTVVERSRRLLAG